MFPMCFSLIMKTVAFYMKDAMLFSNKSQIFSTDGQFKNRFGVRGRSPGQLQRPTGVAVHPCGDIIIADYDNKWVSIFSSDGKFKVGLKSKCKIQGNVFFFLKINS